MFHTHYRCSPDELPIYFKCFPMYPLFNQFKKNNEMKKKNNLIDMLYVDI